VLLSRPATSSAIVPPAGADMATFQTLLLIGAVFAFVFWLIWKAIDSHFVELARREKQGFDDPLKDADKSDYHHQEKL
jgi:hypothetical protein